MPNLAEKIGFGTALTGASLDGIDSFLEDALGMDIPLPVLDHIGDFKYVFLCSWGLSSVRHSLVNIGERKNKKYLIKIGEWIPKVGIGLATLYYTLGESVLPQILDGTADPKDIPAILIAGISCYLGVNYHSYLLDKFHEKYSSQKVL